MTPPAVSCQLSAIGYRLSDVSRQGLTEDDRVQDFRELQVWEKAHDLLRVIYEATADFPSSEMYGLTAQIRRASVSIAANVAEGCGRGSDADFARFLQMAMGSASETEYLLLLAKDLKFLPMTAHVDLDQRTTEVKRMLTALLSRLKTVRPSPRSNDR